MRQFSLLENIIEKFDTTLRTLMPPSSRVPLRTTPGNELPDEPMSLKEKQHVVGLMRVNHAGEVCAQALYQGQALTAKLTTIKSQMEAAAAEEVDHLAWCEQRLHELDSNPSVLNPFWYAGSFMIGALAGLIGDRWSLGFVAETERQVTAHLQNHLQRLPQHDKKTKAILEQMKEDEALHADVAIGAGAAELPVWIKLLMQNVSRVMTHTSYHI